MYWEDHIISQPEILFGKPVIKGTRVPVDLILEKLATVYTIDDLLQSYPKITREDIQACLLFASDSVKHEKAIAVV